MRLAAWDCFQKASARSQCSLLPACGAVVVEAVDSSCIWECCRPGGGCEECFQLGLVNVAGQDMVVEIAECIGGHGLASVCRLLAEDHAGWSGERLFRHHASSASSVYMLVVGAGLQGFVKPV